MENSRHRTRPTSSTVVTVGVMSVSFVVGILLLCLWSSLPKPSSVAQGVDGTVRVLHSAEEEVENARRLAETVRTGSVPERTRQIFGTVHQILDAKTSERLRESMRDYAGASAALGQAAESLSKSLSNADETIDAMVSKSLPEVASAMAAAGETLDKHVVPAVKLLAPMVRQGLDMLWSLAEAWDSVPEGIDAGVMWIPLGGPSDEQIEPWYDRLSAL